MLLCRFPIDVTADVDAGPRIRLVVSMYRRSVDGAYKDLVEKKAQTGAFDKYVAMILHNIVYAGM